MGILRIVLTLIFIFVCLALVVLVLMQEGKSAGLGSISGAAETYWGPFAANTRTPTPPTKAAETIHASESSRKISGLPTVQNEFITRTLTEIMLIAGIAFFLLSLVFSFIWQENL